MLDIAEKQEVVVKDKEERRLSKVKIAIMRNPKFALWSGLMTVGKTRVVDSGTRTARTNGRDEDYRREFVKMLDDKELAFVVLHETLHKAYRHLFTWRKLYDENPKIANMACDYVINLQLLDMDKDRSVISMPMRAGKAIGLADERFRGLNTKQVYDILKEEEPEGGYGGGGEGDRHADDESRAVDGARQADHGRGGRNRHADGRRGHHDVVGIGDPGGDGLGSRARRGPGGGVDATGDRVARAEMGQVRARGRVIRQPHGRHLTLHDVAGQAGRLAHVGHVRDQFTTGGHIPLRQERVVELDFTIARGERRAGDGVRRDPADREGVAAVGRRGDGGSGRSRGRGAEPRRLLMLDPLAEIRVRHGVDVEAHVGMR